MLTLIKLIHTLNRRIANATTRKEHFTGSQASQAPIGLQALCAIVALGLAGIGNLNTVQAKPLDKAGIRQSIEISFSKKYSTNRSAKIEIDRALQTKQVIPSKQTKQKSSISQNPPAPATPAPQVAPAPQTPPAPDNNSNGRIKNSLDLPKTGAEVQITNNQALTLKEAIDIAFRNNRDVQAARLTVSRSELSIREAQAAQAIQVGLTGTLSNSGSPLIVGTASQFNTNSGTDIQGRVQATYNLLNAGRDAGSVRAAEEQVKFDRLDLVRVQQSVRGNVLTAYYDLQQADSAAIINQAAVKDATRSLSDAQLQEKAGVGTKFDILRAQVQLATANQDLTNSQGQQQIARKRIAQLLSVDNNTEYKAADAVNKLGSWGLSLEDSVVLAYKNRPEVKQQIARRSISEQQSIVASAADSAQVNLFTNYTLGKSISTSASAQDSYSLGAQLSWNFWDGGAARARTSQQQVSQEIAENQFTTARNQIRFEVEQSYNNLGTNEKNITTATQALKQAEESLKLARLRFQAGVGTQTDVIQAQTELARARGNRITAIINYNRALSSLRTATVTVE
jgi:outer membrane protein TolC